jgi:hypothetical protein
MHRAGAAPDLGTPVDQAIAQAVVVARYCATTLLLSPELLSYGKSAQVAPGRSVPLRI